MVTRGAPTVQLLRPAGGRVADVALELRRQNLARRQQNIQADLAEMRGEIDRDRLQESARQFDVNQLFRREALEIESALSGRRLQISAGQLALGEQRFELTMEQAISQEDRAQRAQNLQENRFDEQLRATRVAEQRQEQQIRRGRESLDAKDFRADIEFIGKNLLRFDPETRQITLPEGLQPLVQKIIDRARERGMTLTIPQLIEAASPVASQIGRQRVQQESRNQLAQGLGRAQIRNLNAAAAEKLGGGGRAQRQTAAQERRIGQQIQRGAGQLEKTRNEIGSLSIKLLDDEGRLEDANEKLRIAQGPLNTELAKGEKADQNLIQTLSVPVAAAQRDVEREQSAINLRKESIERTKEKLGRIGAGLRDSQSQLRALRTQALGLGEFQPTRIPAAPGAQRSQIVSGIISGNRSRQEIDFLEKGLENLETSSTKMDAVTNPEDREFRKLAEDKSRSRIRARLKTIKNEQFDREQAITTGIANMGFPQAFTEMVMVNKQIEDLSKQISSALNLIDSGDISGEELKNTRLQLASALQIGDQAFRHRLQLGQKLADLSEERGNLNRLSQLSIRNIGDASLPENTIAVQQVSRRAEVELIDLYGRGPVTPKTGVDTRLPDERNLTPGEEARKGRQFLASFRNGPYYSKVRNVLDQITRKAIAPREVSRAALEVARRIPGVPRFEIPPELLGDENIIDIMNTTANILKRTPGKPRGILAATAEALLPGFRLPGVDIEGIRVPEGVFMPPGLRGTLLDLVSRNQTEGGLLKSKTEIKREFKRDLIEASANGTWSPELIPVYKTAMLLRGFRESEIEETLRPFDYFGLMGPREEVIRPTFSGKIEIPAIPTEIEVPPERVPEAEAPQGQTPEVEIPGT